MEPTSAGVTLSGLVKELRAELEAAVDEGKESQIAFELGPVEIEISVRIAQEAGARGGLRIWVIEAGADTNVARESIQHLKLVLHPRQIDGSLDGAATSRPAIISGAAVTGETE